MKIALLPGDGIGPEVVYETVKVLDEVAKKSGTNFEYKEVDGGGCAIDKYGCPLPEESLKACLDSDSVLMGAMGGPKWDNLPGDKRPEAALLGLRKGLEVFANLRPAILFPELKNSSSLKPEVIGQGIDILVVRELIGGIYFGPRKKEKIENGYRAMDTEVYSTYEIERIARVAFEAAMKRNKKVCSVDKANILESSRLWRQVVTEVAKDYPEVELNYLYVDNCSMQLVRDPRQFDVIVTTNMFGDILSDEAAMLTGSMGMLPSASLGSTSRGIYEPVHGSAPDIAGKKLANPIATILSAAMMLRYGFHMNAEAVEIENAISDVLKAGYRTKDIMEPGMTEVNTNGMTEQIIKSIKNA